MSISIIVNVIRNWNLYKLLNIWKQTFFNSQMRRPVTKLNCWLLKKSTNSSLKYFIFVTFFSNLLKEAFSVSKVFSFQNAIMCDKNTVAFVAFGIFSIRISPPLYFWVIIWHSPFASPAFLAISQIVMRIDLLTLFNVHIKSDCLIH